jgi:desampylase
MPARVSIANEARDAILTHARAEAPGECCGVLVGRPDLIERAIAAHNAAPHPATRFLVDPRDHFEAIRAARATGRMVVGYYHSHPAGPPVPSPTDLAESGEAEAIHVIAGAGAGGPLTELRAYRLIDGETVIEVELV